MVNKIKEILKEYNFFISLEREIAYGYEVRLVNGVIICIYPHKAKYHFQGRFENIRKVADVLENGLKGGKK